MIPERWVEAYLRFLLRNRLAVTLVIAVMTVFFAYAVLAHQGACANFLDFYPSAEKISAPREGVHDPRGASVHQDLQRLPADVRERERAYADPRGEEGDIYNPTTLQKLDQMTTLDGRDQGRRAVPDPLHRAPEDEEHHHVEGAIQIREVF